MTGRRLSELIAKVTANPSYRDKARWFQKVLRDTRGLEVAADTIEREFGKYLEGNEAVLAKSSSRRDAHRQVAESA